MKLRAILLTGVFCSLFAFQAFAAVDITNRTGTIEITMPDGTAVTITADQPLPEIPDGAVITVTSGSANITTSGTSTVSVSIGGSTLQVSAGTTVNLGLNEAGTANIAVTAGQAVVSCGGTSATVGANSSINVTLNTATNTGSFQVVSGSVVFQLPDGTSVTRDPSNPTVEFTAEPYSPPPLPDVPNVRNEVTNEEAGKDISPSK
ncbi:MAG: hypothetical protein V1869_02980 [Candidatus Omnitrophota bacterium]